MDCERKTFVGILQVCGLIKARHNYSEVKFDGDDANSSLFINYFKGQKAKDAPGKNSS